VVMVTLLRRIKPAGSMIRGSSSLRRIGGGNSSSGYCCSMLLLLIRPSLSFDTVRHDHHPQRAVLRLPPLHSLSPAAPRLHVVLEQPVTDLLSPSSASSLLWKQPTSSCWMTSKSFRITCLAVALLACFWAAVKTVSSGGGFVEAIETAFHQGRRRLVRTWDDLIHGGSTREEPGIAMPFDDDAEGWGVGTLRSKERLGATSFFRYVFDLPDSDYVLPLELGETVRLCCLDNESNDDDDGEGKAVQAEFYTFQPERHPRPGSFSILVPDPSIAPLLIADHQDPGGSSSSNLLVGSFNSWNDAQQAKIATLLQNELQVGDEIAIQPTGVSRLQHRGRHEVTNMLYIAVGTGIAPVLDQVRAILPDASAAPSVQSVSVLYINDAADDFDVTAQLLEQEYHRYSDKLDSVDCVVMDYMAELAGNPDMDEAVPTFQPGTMAVLAGPSASMKKIVAFLQQERGFPRECICVL